MCVLIPDARYAVRRLSSNARAVAILIFTIATTTMSRYKITMSQRLFRRRRSTDFTSERFATVAMMTASALRYSVRSTRLNPRAKGSRRRASEPAERTNYAAHSPHRGRTILQPCGVQRVPIAGKTRVLHTRVPVLEVR